MTGMDDLVTFLRAQLDDDERVATAAYPNVWHVEETRHGEFLIVPDHFPSTPAIARTEPNAEHIARWDPARVLAEVDAKRRILDLHVGAHDCTEIHTGVYPDDWPADAGWGKAGQPWAHAVNEHFEADQHCPTVVLLALPYAGHEGYREEWRPS